MPFSLEDICKKDDFQLPIARDTKKQLSQQLRDLFDQYALFLRQADLSDQILREVHCAIALIEDLQESICSVVDKYLKGDLHGAYNELDRVLCAIRKYLLVLTSRNMTSCLYRLRKGSADAIVFRKDMFHNPFELRHIVSTARYSIAGLPCLYLGGSVGTCWEELDRPEFSSLSLALFQSKNTVKTIDFGFRLKTLYQFCFPTSSATQSEFYTDQLWVAYLICWPLMAACTIRKPDRKGAIFVEEYIVPQLLMQWMQKDSEIDGIRYLSTKIDQPCDKDAYEIAINYAFPAKKITAKGYCSSLASKFELTEPMRWNKRLRFVPCWPFAVCNWPKTSSASEYERTCFKYQEKTLQALGKLDMC